MAQHDGRRQCVGVAVNCPTTRMRDKKTNCLAPCGGRYVILTGMSPNHYTQTAAWVESLPGQSLAAYDACKVSVELPHAIAAAYPQLALAPGLPKAWQAALRSIPGLRGWMPETLSILQYLLLRHSQFSDDQTFLQASKTRIKDSFLHPAVRPLMALMTPHLLILGASTRWNLYHQGTQLQVRSTGQRELRGSLRFPDALYPDLLLADFRVAIEASIELAGKQPLDICVTRTEPGVCSVVGAWR